MPDGGVSDAEIAAMSATERRELIHRLERPLAELLPEAVLARVRRVRLVLMIGAIVGLVPWTVYLAITLPDKYIAHDWLATWVGFDVLLLVFIASTAPLGLLRRQLSVLTAVVGELPLAALLITGALRILRLTATRLYMLDPGMPLWRIPLLP
jgi:hypothetical protein